MKSLRDKGVAEFPKGIAAKAHVFLTSEHPRPQPLERFRASTPQRRRPFLTD
jgi:hypothetical protein